MQYYFSFDVESVGLFGPPFAYGIVVVDGNGKELETKTGGVHRILARLPDREGSDWDWTADDIAWVRANVLPALSPIIALDTCATIDDLCISFYREWVRCKEMYPGIIMVTDCPFPVESNFLRCTLYCTDKMTMQDSPYPIIDVASVLLAHGMDPAATYARLPNELPAHNPVNDARQSVRLMLEAMNGVARVEDIANLDVPGLR